MYRKNDLTCNACRAAFRTFESLDRVPAIISLISSAVATSLMAAPRSVKADAASLASFEWVAIIDSKVRIVSSRG